MNARVAVLTATVVVGLVLSVAAQDVPGVDTPPNDTLAASREEWEAFRLAETGHPIRARELAERIVASNRRSYVGHLVLGLVQHRAEANFPRALYQEELALRLFMERHGRDGMGGDSHATGQRRSFSPDEGTPWRWHMILLRELAMTHGDLEHYEERLQCIGEYNELYDPDMVSEQAWPFMKLGRYADARRAARLGLATGDDWQAEQALNALCAIEFEAGNDGTSYEACGRALEFGRGLPEGPDAVDFTNHAEAARSLFRLDESERLLQEATSLAPTWYGNPWSELAALYTREARFAEALSALKKVPAYRAQRPPFVRESDRSESRRNLSEFFVVVGRAEDAIRLTEKALLAPDRRGHQSRDPEQDLAIAALLDRRARLVQAETIVERASAQPWYRCFDDWAEASWLRFQAWMSERQAVRRLSDDARLVGTFRIGTSRSAIVPPWIASELAQVLGTGVMEEAIDQAARQDRRDGARDYYDAFRAEIALHSGDHERARTLADNALAGLGIAEALLRARMEAVRAQALLEAGQERTAAAAFENVLEHDPGAIRRMELSVPIRIEGERGEVAERIADALRDSPRFDESDVGLTVQIVRADQASGKVCLLGRSRSVLACGEASAQIDDDVDALTARIVDDFHDKVFAPRIDLSQSDANSLDGSNRQSRNPVDTMLEP